jgi:hypothetical protein
MKLTVKDKEFLERVRELMQNKELSVDFKTDGYKRMVLRGNYGDKIDQTYDYPGKCLHEHGFPAITWFLGKGRFW